MKIDNEDKLFVSMEINIWKNKDSNGLFYYNNNLNNEFKKVYFNFDKSKKDCFLIKTKDNYIETIDDQKDFNENERKEILFRIRNSLKYNNYEVMNPIFSQKIITSDYNNFLKEKIWFSVRSQPYLGGNEQNYNLNENDIIKFGKKKYNITKIHFVNENKKEDIIDENFYKYNNISYVSIINKKSKPVINININLKPNKYKISNNKKINIEKANQENVNDINEGKVNKLSEINKVNEVNIKKPKNNNKNNNETNIDSNYNNINFKNSINNTNNNILNNNTSSQNNDKIDKNNYQINSISLPTNDHSNNAQNRNGIENNNDSENENENDRCLCCFNSNCNKDNPLIKLCNCNDFIHYECLKSYLTSKITVTQNLKNPVTTYNCKNFNCNICLKPYPLRFRIPEIDRTYELIDLNLPEEKDYICLESLDYIKDNNNIKKVHIAQLIGEEIYIGRENYNDIIDDDMSVSRAHAVIKYNIYNKSLFLENRYGRYGTLVLVRGNIKVNEEKTYFQIQNTHVSMKLTKKKNFDKIGKESFQFNVIYDNNDNCNNDNQW